MARATKPKSADVESPDTRPEREWAEREKAFAAEHNRRTFALGRVLWRDSDEYRRMNRWQAWVGVGAAVISAAGGVLFATLVPDTGRGFSPSLYGFLGAFLVLYLVWAAIYVNRTMRRRHFMERQRLGLETKLQDQEREIAESGKDLNLATLWAANQGRLEYYHKLATSQSEASFRNGTIASVAGFVLLLTIGIVGAFSISLNASIAVGVVGIAGAAMASYLGATFMKTQSQASAQLRQFFLQPVEFSRLLGAERLIETLPPGDRAAAVQLVVSAMVNPASAKQIENDSQGK